MASLEQTKRGGRNGYANAVLTVTAVALVAVALRLSGGAPANAQAGQRSGSNDTQEAMGMPNAFAQRQRMIGVLEGMDQRLRSLEAKLGGGAPLDVRVINVEEISAASTRPERE